MDVVGKVPVKACLNVSWNYKNKGLNKGTYHSREVLISFAWYIMIAALRTKEETREL